MSLKKLYVDTLLGETLRKFRKGQKYIDGTDDESNDEIAEYKRNYRSRELEPNTPRLRNATGLEVSINIS